MFFFENLLFKFSNQINSNPQRSWFIDIRLYYMKWTICIYINIIIYPKLCKSTRVLAEWGEVPGFLLATTFQSSQTSGVMWSLKYQQSFAALMIPRAANQPQLRRRTIGVPGAFFWGGQQFFSAKTHSCSAKKISSQGGPSYPILFCQADVPCFCVTLFCQS